MKTIKFIGFILLLVVVSGCTTVPLSGEASKNAAQVNAELGQQYLQRNELEIAKTKLEKALQQDKKNALAQVTYGTLLQRTGDMKGAEKYFRRAIKLEPENAEHYNKYGVYLCEARDYERAEQQFITAAENPYYKTPEFALDNAGICMLDGNNLVGAEKYLRSALNTNPKFPGSWLHMAQLLHRKQRLTESSAYLSGFRERNGRDTAESLLLSINVNRDLGKTAEAKRAADKLLSDFPRSREAGEYLARPLI